MGNHVIALGRQFGSGGREIGRKLGETLGFAYYDRELLTLAAKRAEVREELLADKDEKAANPWLFKGFYEGRSACGSVWRAGIRQFGSSVRM